MATKPKNRQEPPAEVARIDLVAVEPIRIDGVDVAPGEPFDALPPDAEALQASGAARLPAAE